MHDVDALQDLLLRVLQPFAIALIAGGATVALLWWLLPAAGAIVLVALLLAATVVPWLTARESGRAQAQAQLSAVTVETLDGAPELLVNGALGGRLRTLARARRRADPRRRRRRAQHGHRARAGDAADRAGVVGDVLVAIDADLDPVLLAVVALVPLATFELVGGLPAVT